MSTQNACFYGEMMKIYPQLPCRIRCVYDDMKGMILFISP